MPTDAGNTAPTPATPEQRRTDLDGLVNRFLFEHDLLVKRTAAILTFNGLFAATIAAGERLPVALKVVTSLMLLAVNAVWMARAASIRQMIEDLNAETRRPEYDAVLPPHVRVHRRRTSGRSRTWFSTYVFFSVGIPAALIVFWLTVLLTVGLTPPPRP